MYKGIPWTQAWMNEQSEFFRKNHKKIHWPLQQLHIECSKSYSTLMGETSGFFVVFFFFFIIRKVSHSKI